MMLLAIISSVAWFVFEYLNFFILENWYYPNDKVFTTYGNYVWYLTSYTIIFPATFEFYHLFETIPWLKDKYAYGPKITFSKTFKTFILLFGILSSILMGLYPQEFFFTIWLNPAMIMGAMLGLLGFENLFTQLKNGNWTKMLLVAISMLSIAFIWEFINWGSGFFNSDQQINASYWKYSIPYIGLIQLPFSEMPILGYFGYIPYAWICWIQWNVAANLFGFDADVSLDNELN
ncbi:MAG: hypothetical protein KDK90_25125 [Leptospiraceae bacterium]|nr:hypothetical protein [Leptospiraceae bacterium]